MIPPAIFWSQLPKERCNCWSNLCRFQPSWKSDTKVWFSKILLILPHMEIFQWHTKPIIRKPNWTHARCTVCTYRWIEGIITNASRRSCKLWYKPNTAEPRWPCISHTQLRSELEPAWEFITGQYVLTNTVVILVITISNTGPGIDITYSLGPIVPYTLMSRRSH